MFKKSAVILSVLPIMAWAKGETLQPATHGFDAGYFEIAETEVRELKVETLNIRGSSGRALKAIGSQACSVGERNLVLKNAEGAESANTEKEAKAESKKTSVNGAGTATGTILQEVQVAEMVVDNIINIGKKIWNVLESGRPVVNLHNDVATALPEGAGCWMDLQAWRAPKSGTYEVVLKNLYGMEVVRFKYRVMFVYGGSVNGQGQYIGYAAIQPADVSVAWGYELNAQAEAPTVFNMGTKSNPVAGMNLQISYTVKTIFKEIQSSQVYHLSGAGDLRQMD